ncbi:unnamed protein product [Calypogeia fissa]
MMEFTKKCPTSNALCVIIWLLLTWIAVDHIFTSGLVKQQTFSLPPAVDRTSEPQTSTIHTTERAQNSICDTRDGHYEPDDTTVDIADLSSEDAWSQMKWIGQPAPCRVRGELIEKLDDINNFRRGFALRFTSNVEDRIHILPWLLGSKVDLNQRERRVFLDLGSNTFSSSLQWFLRMYPCDFSEIVAFEVRSNLLQIPKPFDEKKNVAAENAGSRRTKGTPGIPGWMLKRIKVYNKLVSHKDDENSGSVNITRFIKHELKLKPEDAVVVKMDIEGSEWPVLTSWLNDPEMVQIVDEIFVEVHYKHSSMYNFNWHRFGKARGEAKRLLADLRWKGFYAHFWP